MKVSPTIIFVLFAALSFAQTTVYVRNSTWQDFDVEAGQYGTVTVAGTEWQGGDPVVRSWIETSGQEVLTVNRTNNAVPEGDTAFFDIGLLGDSDVLTIKLRLIGVANGTELAYSVSGDGFSEPWFDDGNFHEVQTELAGRSVVIKFKPDNDDTNQDRDLRFAIHDLPVYDIDSLDYENPNVMNAMFYNIQMISFGVSGLPQANERGSLLPAQISQYQDVVCFAEAFDDGPREDHLIPAMEAAGFPYRTTILNEPGGFIPFPVNGGVIIFSRWPIEAEDEIDFAECGQAASDCLANKGVKYARVNKLGKRYHIFGTHMDAGSNTDDIFARRTQMAEIRDFILALDISDGEPVIFGGDFNTDPIDSDMDYQAFLDTMQPVIPQHIGYWESNFNDDFGKIIDHAWMDRYHLVPTVGTNEVITIRSLDSSLWDLYEFSDHRCILGRFVYPDIEQVGGDTLVCPGESLSLSVETDHSITYQWFKDGTAISGETGNSFQLLDAQESESGLYTCLVSYDMIYGQWGDSLTAVFYPNGADTVEARLNYEFDITIDQVLCELSTQDIDTKAVSIYPNPASGILNVRLSDVSKKSEVRIYSTQGKLLLSEIGGANHQLDISELSTCVYLIQVKTGNNTFHQRFAVY
jgi:exonuclease III